MAQYLQIMVAAQFGDTRVEIKPDQLEHVRTLRGACREQVVVMNFLRR
jgi:hypothetical protein